MEETEYLSAPSQLLILIAYLHRDGVISTVGRSLLKDIVVENGDQAIYLFERFSKRKMDLNENAGIYFTVIQRSIEFEAHKHFDNLYLDFPLETGKVLSRGERQSKNLLSSKSLIYGEVEYLSFITIMKKLNLDSTEDKVFYDLGSGTGRAVMATRLNFDFKTCVGIEYLSSLYTASKSVKNKYDAQVMPILNYGSNSKFLVDFHCCSFLEYDWSNGDVCFANSTCFNNALIKNISTQAEKMKEGSYFITFTKPLESVEFDIVLKERFQMSWGPATVFIHKKKGKV